ncbi:MAG: helix-turn-helix transcriptional regulator [Treponema sp.]|nr:helix-turn-helix transcriptional regulator [Treponema sp.]
MKESEIAVICKALGDVNRVNIIKMLTGGELCACKILDAFNITQPTLSHHMKILTDCSLVNSRKEGKWTYYSINSRTFSAFKDAVSKFTCKSSGNKKTDAKKDVKCCCRG